MHGSRLDVLLPLFPVPEFALLLVPPLFLPAPLSDPLFPPLLPAALDDTSSLPPVNANDVVNTNKKKDNIHLAKYENKLRIRRLPRMNLNI